jgi:hypothetical protein
MKGELLDWLIQIEPEPISLTCNPSKQAQVFYYLFFNFIIIILKMFV